MGNHIGFCEQRVYASTKGIYTIEYVWYCCVGSKAKIRKIMKRRRKEKRRMRKCQKD